MQWENVYIFISSTFNDMHAERDYLVKKVFPELTAWCEDRKLRLIDIDLRWGIREEDATINKNVVEVCLDRIDECRPFFLCFLGQRRGWIPQEDDVSPKTKSKYPDIDEYIGKFSITEMEIEHALISPMQKLLNEREILPKPADYAFFYLRSDDYLTDLPLQPPELREIYTNEHIKNQAEKQKADEELSAWKTRIRGKKHVEYRAVWDPQSRTPEIENEQIAGLSEGRLTGFNSDGVPLDRIILMELREAITDRYPDRAVTVSEDTGNDKELEQQQLFISQNTESFITRDGDFAELRDYTFNNNRKLFILAAPAGMGKSMLLANFVSGLSDVRVVSRFIGASENSSNPLMLWKSIFSELGADPPETLDALRIGFFQILEKIGRKNRTIIVLDGLDQLYGGMEELQLLPRELPEGVKLIVSVKSGARETDFYLKALLDEGKAIFTTIKPFSDNEEKRAVIRLYLQKYLKALDERHIQALCAVTGSENPLFLKIVLSELRVFGAYARLGETIGRFGETPQSAFDVVLARLEEDPAYCAVEPEKAVPYLFGLLAFSRKGLTETELTACLRYEFPGLSVNDAKDTIRLYLRQMRLFMARREGRADFLYDSFKLAAQKRYGSIRSELNDLLIRCFSDVCDPNGNDLFENEDPRALQELGYHKSQSDMKEGAKLYNSLAYLHARCSCTDVGELLLELSWLEPSGNSVISGYMKMITRYTRILSGYKNSLFSIAYYAGFAEARDAAYKLVSEKKWNRPYICMEKIATVTEEPATAAGNSIDETHEEFPIEVLSNIELKRSVASALAGDREIVFYTDGIGRIGILNTITMIPHPGIIATRPLRPLCMYASVEGSHLVVLFDNGTADLVQIFFDDSGVFAYSKIVREINYFLPMYEDGVMAFYNDMLWYQEDESGIVCAEAGDGNSADNSSDDGADNSSGNSPDNGADNGADNSPGNSPESGEYNVRKKYFPINESPGELSSIIPFDKNSAFFTIRRPGCTVVFTIKNSVVSPALRINGVDVKCAVKTSRGEFAVAFTDGFIRIFNETPAETASRKFKKAVAAMCDTGEGLVAQSEWLLGRHMYNWRYIEGGNISESHNRLHVNIEKMNMKSNPDGSILMMCEREVTRVSISSEKKTSEPEILAVYDDGRGGDLILSHKHYSFMESGKDVFTVKKGAVTESYILADQVTPSFFVRTTDEIIALNMHGIGFVVDTHTLRIRLLEFSSSVQAVTGDSAEGFYICDNFGRLAHYPKNIPLPDLSDYKLSDISIFSGGKHLILTGFANNPKNSDENHRILAAFYEIRFGFSLIPLGVRYFENTKSTILTVKYDTKTGNIYCFFRNSVRFGSIDEFLTGAEREKNLPYPVRSDMSVELIGDDLYICSDGTVSVFDVATLEYRAAIAAVAPIRFILKKGENPSLLYAVEGKNTLAYIHETKTNEEEGIKR